MLINLAGKGLLPGGLGYSEYANWGEQLYRELLNTGGKQAPDPEKYCVNVWGVQLADLLWKLANPDQPFELFDDTKTNPYSDLAGDTVSLDQQQRGGYTPADLQLIGIHSPVDALIEVNGETLVLDQKHGVLVGNPSRPVTVAPEGNGTYMLGLTALASEPVKMTLRGSTTGIAHVLRLDTRTGTMTTWESKVKAGTKLVLDLSQPDAAADVTRALTDADGKAIPAEQVNLLTETGPTTMRLLIALFVALLLGAWWWRCRSFRGSRGGETCPGRCSSASPRPWWCPDAAATSGAERDPERLRTGVGGNHGRLLPELRGTQTMGPHDWVGDSTSRGPYSSEDFPGGRSDNPRRSFLPSKNSSRRPRRHGSAGLGMVGRLIYSEGGGAADDKFPEGVRMLTPAGRPRQNQV